MKRNLFSRHARSPRFTALVVLTVALSSVFILSLAQVLDALYFRPLPYPNAGSLALISAANTAASVEQGAVAGDDFFDWRQRLGSVRALGLLRIVDAIIETHGEPRRAPLAEVTASTFTMLGVRPVAGRSLTASDMHPPCDAVVVISRRLAMAEYGSPDQAVSRLLTISGRPFTVIGVLPDEFNFFEYIYGQRPDLVIPVALIHNVTRRDNRVYQVLAALKPGYSFTQLNSELKDSSRSLASLYPDEWTGWVATARPLRKVALRELDRGFPLLLGGAFAIYLIGCLNVAMLFTARGLQRRKDTAVRLALGAGLWDVLRGGLIETTVLVAAGGCTGAFLTPAFLSWCASLFGLSDLLRAQLYLLRADLMSVLLVTTLLLVAVSSALCAPLLMVRNGRWLAWLRGGSGTGVARSLMVSLEQGAVAGQIAVCFALVLVAMLLAKSFYSISAFDRGYHPDKVLSLEVELRGDRYETGVQQEAYVRRVTEALQTLPFVRAVTTADRLPTQPPEAFRVALKPASPGGLRQAGISTVGANYFSMLGIPVLWNDVARPDDDDPRHPKRLAVVNQAFRYNQMHGALPNRHTKVQIVDFGPEEYDIVGMVADTRANPFAAAEPEVFRIGPLNRMFVLVKTAMRSESTAHSIFQAIQRVDRDVVVGRPRSLEEQSRVVEFAPEAKALTLSSIAATALLLALISIGCVSFEHTTMRMAEYALRCALGASSREVAMLVLYRSLKMTAIGVLAGAMIFAALAPLLRASLLGVKTTSPEVWMLCLALLTSGTALAAVPAIRTSRKANLLGLLRSE